MTIMPTRCWPELGRTIRVLSPSPKPLSYDEGAPPPQAAPPALPCADAPVHSRCGAAACAPHCCAFMPAWSAHCPAIGLAAAAPRPPSELSHAPALAACRADGAD